MLKLKKEVKGFIYNSEIGNIVITFTGKKGEKDWCNWGEDDVFVDNENVNELFEITSKEELENDIEGLNKVLDWVK